MPINKNREDFRFYQIWADMKTRCNNPKCKKYHLYDGRGITYDKRWDEYSNFKLDMYTSYIKHVQEHGEKQTTLDRINPNFNYTSMNCRWATYKEQSANIRDKQEYLAYNMITKEFIQFKNCTDFCKENGLTRQRVVDCLAGKSKFHKNFLFIKIDKTKDLKYHCDEILKRAIQRGMNV